MIKVCAAPKGMVLHRSGLKTGIDFAHFGLESAMAFKGTTGVDEGIVRFKFQIGKKETERFYIYIYICIFCCCSNLSIRDDINS